MFKSSMEIKGRQTFWILLGVIGSIAVYANLEKITRNTQEVLGSFFNVGETSRSRVARQTFNRDALLVSMGSTMIANVANEHMAAYLQKFTGHEIVVIAKVLNDTERMRVLMSLTGEEVLNLTERMTPEERGELLSLLSPNGIVNLVRPMTQDQVESLLLSLPIDDFLNITEALSPEQNFQIMQKLSPNGFLSLMESMNSHQAVTILGRLPLDGVLNLTTAFTDDDMSRVMVITAAFTLQDLTNLISALPASAFQTLSSAILQNLLNASIQSLPQSTQIALVEWLLPELSEIVSRVADNMTQTNVSECLADLQIAFSSLVQDNFAQNRRNKRNTKMDSRSKNSVKGTSRTRVARQTSFNRDALLVSMGPTMIANVANEHMAAYLQKFTGHEIVVVAEVLNDTERMRVLMPLTGEEILNLTERMTPEERGELLLLLPADGIVSLTEKLTQDQLETLMMSLPSESVFNIILMLSPEQNFEIIKKLSPNGVLGLMESMDTHQAATILGRLPLEGIVNLTKTFSSDELSRVKVITAAFTLRDWMTFISAIPDSDIHQFLNSIATKLMNTTTTNIIYVLFPILPEVLSLTVEKISQTDGLHLDGTDLQACMTDLQATLNSITPEEWDRIIETTTSAAEVTTSHGHHDITCTESRMEFSIPLSSPHTSETATLSDPNCLINVTRTHVRGGVDLNSCGTTVQFQNDSVIFRNAIIFSAPESSSLGSSGSNSSVSQYQDIIPIQCVYNRIATVHLSYMPVVRRVLFTESGVGQFSFNIQQFWDASFTNMVSDGAYPLRMELDADVFIQLSVGSEGQPVAGHKEIGMEVQQCLVSPSSSVIEAQLHYYPLIQDGCPASSDVHIIPNTNASDSTVMRFRFRAVNFFDPSSSSSSSLVFVHCRMGLCLTGSCKPSAWSCLTPPARRVRRDVDQSKRAAHQLSTGPFLIMADQASTSSSSTTATVMAVVSTSVATVAIVIAAIALIALRRRRTTERN